MSTYICIGSIGTVALFGAIAVAIYFMVQLHKRYITWRINGELAELKRLKAKYDTAVDTPVANEVVFNPVATYKIANAATKVELIKDSDGQPALQFNYADDDGSKTYALLSNGVMHIRLNNNWRVYGDRKDASDMLLNMVERKQLPQGEKRKGNRDNSQGHDDNNQDDIIPLKRVRTWYDNHTTFENKPKGKMPKGWRWQQVSGGDFAVVKVRDENGD